MKKTAKRVNTAIEQIYRYAIATGYTDTALVACTPSGTPRNNWHCVSENGGRVALRTIGFTKEQITPHGFRAMFSTIANEYGINRNVIEGQLAQT